MNYFIQPLLYERLRLRIFDDAILDLFIKGIEW